jgi:hypothetical protein
MSSHSFPVNIAKIYSVHEAIILQHIYYWHQRNKANNKHFYDNHYWTYNSIEAFSEIFSYLSAKQIRYILDKLEKEGLILTGNYNDNKFDRTLWYCLTIKGLMLFDSSICQNSQMEKPNFTNGEGRIGKSNIDNTDINTDINTIALQRTHEQTKCNSRQVSPPLQGDTPAEAKHTLALPDITFDRFKEKWGDLSKNPPNKGWDKAYAFFFDSWDKMSQSKKDLKYNSWAGYLEEWISKEFVSNKNSAEPKVNTPAQMPISDALEDVSHLLNIEYQKINEEYKKHLTEDFTSNAISTFLDKVTIMGFKTLETGAVKPVLHFGSKKVELYATYHCDVKFRRNMESFTKKKSIKLYNQTDWYEVYK